VDGADQAKNGSHLDFGQVKVQWINFKDLEGNAFYPKTLITLVADLENQDLQFTSAIKTNSPPSFRTP
jgi:hypothetical protein